MYEELIKKLEMLTSKAYLADEVPVGACVVKNGKIIASAYNQREKNKDVCGHAEILAIKKACKILKDWRLCDCDLFVTLKPCVMCAGVIVQSRIKNVYYFCESNMDSDFVDDIFLHCDCNHKVVCKKLCNDNFEGIIKKYFNNKRRKE